MTLLPDGIAPLGALFLVAAAYGTSFLTAAVGIGGGVVLLAAMAYVVPVAALVPLHGVVQLSSNTGRAVLLSRDAALAPLVPFSVGAAAGAVVGGALVTELPESAILLAVGLFVVATTWVRLPPLGRGEGAVVGIGGAVATVLTMFIGATGPFVMALLRPATTTHRSLVATNAVAMTVQHALKVVVFGALGFAFAQYAGLLAMMVGAGFLGTLTGARVLDRLPERLLANALRIVLTVIGAELVVRAVLRMTGQA